MTKNLIIKILILLLAIFSNLDNNCIAQSDTVKRFPVPDNFIDYSIFPKISEVLTIVYRIDRNYPYTVITQLKNEQINYYLEKDTIKEATAKFYRFYMIEIAYCDECEENKDSELMYLLSNTNRFIKVGNDWLPVVFHSDYDRDFYLSKFYNDYTEKSDLFMNLSYPSNRLIVAISGNKLKILKIQ